MKTIRVVAAVIRAVNGDGRQMIFATQRGYGEFRGGWEFPGGKIEDGETPQEALKREIIEELETEIKVGDLIDTIEYDYPTFHLSMDCFWAEIVSGDLILKEHEAAKWLTMENLNSVEWLPADVTLIDKIASTVYEKYKKMNIDGSLICLEETSDAIQYFCYPTNAKAIVLRAALCTVLLSLTATWFSHATLKAARIVSYIRWRNLLKTFWD